MQWKIASQRLVALPVNGKLAWVAVDRIAYVMEAEADRGDDVKRTRVGFSDGLAYLTVELPIEEVIQRLIEKDVL